jgi:hypothetical protein
VKHRKAKPVATGEPEEEATEEAPKASAEPAEGAEAEPEPEEAEA